MNYGFGKTFSLPGKFTALNGCAFMYELTASVDLEHVAAEGETELETAMKQAVAEANMLRILETLRGAQPVLVSVDAVNKKLMRFTLEQAFTFGDNSVQQVSKHGKYDEEAPAVIAKLFADASCKFEMKALVAEKEDIEDIKDLVIVDGAEALVVNVAVKDMINK